jgi:hypothetical protein
MPSVQQKLAIGDELLTAIRRLKTGLRELNRLDGPQTFFTCRSCSSHQGLSG